MACLFLPCDSEDWWEDKKLFLLLFHLRSLDEFTRFINAHSRSGAENRGFSIRLRDLQGLRAFLEQYCSPEEQQNFFKRTLPFIAKSASCLDERVPESGIPFLERYEAVSLVLGRKLVVSLLANAFLCTFPLVHSDSGEEMPPFNFNRFFATFLQEDELKRKTQAAKLKCILCYFSQVAERDLQGVITLRRQVISKGELPSMAEWVGCPFPLCQVVVNNDVGIEEAGSHTLQVDFANHCIGGATLEGGCVQEEIRFCICPELIISMLIMGPMDDNEAVIITGAERFANYKGYGASLEFGGECNDIAERDVFGNLLTSLVAIDALPFYDQPADQYKEVLIVRELDKAYVGFLCQQDRGDISTNLLAFSVKRPSIAFIEEYYPDFGYHTTTSAKDTLGNIHSSTHGISRIAIPTSFGGSPLSPVQETSETPRSSKDYGQPQSSHFPDLASGLVSTTMKAGIHQTTSGKEESKDKELDQIVASEGTDAKSEGPQTVSEFASKLTDTLFESLAASAPTPKLAAKSREETKTKPSTMDNLVASLTDSILKSSMMEKDSRRGVDEPDSVAPDSASSPPPPPPSMTQVETQAEELAKSIISDVLSTAKTPSIPSASTQTVGQPSSTSPAGVGVVETQAEELAKSILSDVLSTAKTPSALTQTVGQLSNTSPAGVGVVETQAEELAKSILSDVLSTAKTPSIPSASTRQLSGTSPAGVGVVKFANQLAHSIISNAISAQSPPTRPRILIQADRIGSGPAESPLSSRSSSLTGQPLTLHEYTDDLIESTVMNVLSESAAQIAVTLDSHSEEEAPSRQLETPTLPISNEIERLADSIVSLSIQDVMQQKKQKQERERGSPIIPAAKAVKKHERAASCGKPPQGRQPALRISNLRSKRRSSIGSEHSEVASSDGEYQPQSLPSINPNLLSTPSSRMSYAWSVASTRDEESRPVSPTDMDRIALGLTTNLEEFSDLLADMIVQDVLADVEMGSEDKVMSPLILDSNFESNLLMEPTKGHMKVDTFLNTLDEVELEPVGEEEVDAMETYTARWHKMRRVLLRPVATGNWGCGVFQGDPQLKAMIQWAAVSAAGRPQMMYFPFNDRRVKQLSEITKKLVEQRWTVGRLCQALCSYSQKSEGDRETHDLFSALLAA